MANRGWRIELFRYAAVGVATNVVAYFCYLILTYVGLPPQGAMTIVYVSCSIIGFLANRRLTFFDQGSMISSGVRYIIAQAVGYAINAVLLFVFVDRLGYSHARIQAGAIVVVAPVLFVAMKFFVFPRAGGGALRGH